MCIYIDTECWPEHSFKVGKSVVTQVRMNVCETMKDKTTINYISFQSTSFQITKKYIFLLQIGDIIFNLLLLLLYFIVISFVTN